MKLLRPLLFLFFHSAIGRAVSEDIYHILHPTQPQPTLKSTQDGPQHVVAVYKSEPPLTEQEQIQPRRSVTMTNKRGGKYTCTLPLIPTLEDLVELNALMNATEAEAEEEFQEPEFNIVSEFKNSMKDFIDPCFTKLEGYWTYRVCPFGKVEQYHMEGKQKTLIFDLGHYDSEFDQIDNNRATRQYVQHFTGGQSKRKTAVAVQCSISGETKITQVKEKPVHNYMINLVTPAVCEPVKDAKEAYQLLNPLLKGKCLMMNQDWWSYEYCHLKHIKQFHQGITKTEDGAIKAQIQSQYMLGRYHNEPKHMFMKLHRVPGHPENSYVSATYSFGDTCDLSEEKNGAKHERHGNPRNTEVIFRCGKPGEAGSVTSQILSVKETTSCFYAVAIATPLLCSHEAFKQEEAKVERIICYPQKDEQAQTDEGEEKESGEGTHGEGIGPGELGQDENESEDKSEHELNEPEDELDVIGDELEEVGEEINSDKLEESELDGVLDVSDDVREAEIGDSDGDGDGEIVELSSEVDERNVDHEKNVKDEL